MGEASHADSFDLDCATPCSDSVVMAGRLSAPRATGTDHSSGMGHERSKCVIDTRQRHFDAAVMSR